MLVTGGCYEHVHTAVRGCDLVFHQAALPSVPRSIQDPLTSTAVNVTGALNVLLAARDESVRRVVYGSSSSIYGANPELPKHEGMATLPMAPYAVSKLAGEGYCRSFTQVYDLDTVALRYFNVFGLRAMSATRSPTSARPRGCWATRRGSTSRGPAPLLWLPRDSLGLDISVA